MFNYGVTQMKKTFGKITAGIISVVMVLTFLAACDIDSENDSNGVLEEKNNNPVLNIPKAFTEDFEVTYDAETRGMMITNYTGTSVNVYIPDKAEGEPVTKIGERAFAEKDIVSVYIPDTVAVIGDYAFESCKSLTSIAIPDTVTTLGIAAFSGCMGLTNIVIPSSVKAILNFAFADCTELTGILIPNSVKTIGAAAFSACTKLTNLEFPDSVTTIGAAAFTGCTELTSIEFSENMKTIASGAFYKCDNLWEWQKEDLEKVQQRKRQLS